MLYGHSSQNDKDKNFPDFGPQNSQDLLNMMGNLDIGRSNENIFNPSQNDDNQHSLNQAFNQLSQGNFNPFEGFGNPMSNEPLNNKPKGKNQNKKNFNQNNDNNNTNNLLGNMNSYMNPMLNNMNLGQNLGAPNLDDNSNFMNPMLLNNLNPNLLGN